MGLEISLVHAGMSSRIAAKRHGRRPETRAGVPKTFRSSHSSYPATPQLQDGRTHTENWYTHAQWQISTL
jgi:hypothetical protein